MIFLCMNAAIQQAASFDVLRHSVSSSQLGRLLDLARTTCYGLDRLRAMSERELVEVEAQGITNYDKLRLFAGNDRWYA
jgi:hypothetical protein